ncbi:hypothetical protein Rhow_002303 [Rhodococcus wratislaviensis]|uniref:Uncharacterized protein n=1 Tax=Rhodococcus wratislaviensis TaxID=44752 RepID=A0A402C5A8_RHOWR|nr:hypothetical protein Rhow_002303 [Rhodococcus wratislaviensis]
MFIALIVKSFTPVTCTVRFDRQDLHWRTTIFGCHSHVSNQPARSSGGSNGTH